MEDFGTLFSEEDIKIIGNIFQIELEKQERKRAKLVSANLKITMDEIKITQDEKKTQRRSNGSKRKPWIHRKHSGREGKEFDEKRVKFGEPMQWTL